MDGNTEGGWLKRAYWGLVKGEHFIGHFFLLVIRIYWGGMLVITGLGKWMSISGVADYFASINLPFPLVTAYVVATLEVFGGISLFIGLFSRFFSVILTVLFFVAYATAHQDAFVSFFVNPTLFITQEPFLYLYTSLVVMCFGPGFVSIDYWIEKRVYGKGL